jgi:anti-sigma28 factor (negative regulator of flagellin synthesis)
MSEVVHAVSREHFEQLVLKRTGKTPAEVELAALVKQWAARAASMQIGVRTRKVRPIKAKIAEGMYQEDLRLSIAIDRMLDAEGY